MRPRRRAGAASVAAAGVVAGLGARQAHDEHRARPVLAAEADLAVMGGDDAMADRQADAGADALRLGGEERLEHALRDLARDPGAVVRDLDPDGLGVVAGGDPQPALAGSVLQGLLGIDEQVREHLVKLVGIAPDLRQVRRELPRHLDAGAAQAVGDDLERGIDGGVELHPAALPGLAPRHREEGPHDPRAAVGRGADLFRALAGRRIRGQLLEQARHARRPPRAGC